MFLGHDWLIKYNLEVNWKNRTIWFTRCPESCKMKHQDIEFKTRRSQVTENKEQNNRIIWKKHNTTNSENSSDYIQPFTHFFNKKKFKKLLKQWEWDYKINLMEEAPRELNTKAYAMTLKEEEALNQWLNKQLKARLIVELKLRYIAPCFYILKKNSSLQLV